MICLVRSMATLFMSSYSASGTYATYSSRFLILLWQMDSIHKKAPSDVSLRFSVNMVALRR